MRIPHHRTATIKAPAYSFTGPVEPAADADALGEHGVDGGDQAGRAVGGDGRGQPHAPLEQVTEEAGPTGLGLLVADRQVQQVLAPVGGDAPGHQQRLFRAVPTQALEHRIGE
jgi:hypothetical protein